MDKSYAYEISLDHDGAAVRTLSLVGQEKDVLEIGCASGSQSRILNKNMGCTVTAIEINPEAAEHAKPYCKNIILGSIEQIDLNSRLSGEKFDVILFADVLEHLYDPVEALRKVTPHLREGGHVVASIPNIAQISVIYDLIYGKFEYTQTGILDDTHIRFFTRRSVVDLFTKAGLSIGCLDRWAIDIKRENVNYPKDDRDRDVIDFIRTHNPECMTSHFIVRASVDKGDRAGLTLRQAQAELRSLETLALAKEGNICSQETLVRKMSAELNWLQLGIIPRVLRRLRGK
jgi:2-polyprenyl-3-methyl-5-hydroxy-6-metoxy-1,4-benzoquinol methylase